MLIIDAALTEFAESGYERTSTAAICARAGIGSGTFFHYFPTKATALLAILELGSSEVEDWFTERDQGSDPVQVIREWATKTVEDLRDPRLAGFVNAVGSLIDEPEVGAALARDDAVTREGLRPWVQRAQSAGAIRTDLGVDQLVAWLQVLMDGFISRLASDREGFIARTEGAIYLDTIDRFLAPQEVRRPSIRL